MSYPAVTVIIPSYNVESVFTQVLQSVYEQTYPIEEIIIIDNHSLDNTVNVVRNFMRRHTKIPIQLIVRKKMYGISESYNMGAKRAQTEYIVTLHSDSLLPTKGELEKLMKPILSDSTAVVSIPYVVHRFSEWIRYPYWQKCAFSRVVGTQVHSGNGKFDCYRKDAFIQVHGFNVNEFNSTVGAEDADMHRRLKRIGSIVPSEARVIHIHGFFSSYSLKQYIEQRRFLSVSYGKYISIYRSSLKQDLVYFMIKPVIFLCTIGGVFNPLFFIPIALFPFFYMPVMFTSKETRYDPRNILLIIVQWFLIFFEPYWMLRGLRMKSS